MGGTWPRRTQTDNAARTRRRRIVFSVVGAICAVLAAWSIVGYLTIIEPTVDRHPSRADAIVVLGPKLQPRVDEAIDLAKQLHITQIALSIGETPGELPGTTCADVPAPIRLTCFKPDPFDTRGEAREIRALARARDWRSVIVLAPTPQISRARFLVKRCFGGTVQMVPTPDTFGFEGLVKQFFYQSAAFAKALLTQFGC